MSGSHTWATMKITPFDLVREWRSLTCSLAGLDVWFTAIGGGTKRNCLKKLWFARKTWKLLDIERSSEEIRKNINRRDAS